MLFKPHNKPVGLVLVILFHNWDQQGSDRKLSCPRSFQEVSEQQARSQLPRRRGRLPHPSTRLTERCSLTNLFNPYKTPWGGHCCYSHVTDENPEDSGGQAACPGPRNQQAPRQALNQVYTMPKPGLGPNVGPTLLPTKPCSWLPSSLWRGSPCPPGQGLGKCIKARNNAASAEAQPGGESGFPWDLNVLPLASYLPSLCLSFLSTKWELQS